MYVYNSSLVSSTGSIILKKDNNKTYDAIIYSGHVKNAVLTTTHYPNLKIADGSYMTKTENGSQDTLTTAFAKEYWVYELETDGQTTSALSTESTASIRLGEVNGMRFYANFKGNLDEVEELGIIIAPKDLVGDYFTMEDTHIKVVYEHKTYALWENNQFVGSIVGIQDRNIARDFIARAYVVIDGVTYYANQTTVRNIAAIADEYIADANGGFDKLDTDTQALVETWAKAND